MKRETAAQHRAEAAQAAARVATLEAQGLPIDDALRDAHVAAQAASDAQAARFLHGRMWPDVGRGAR